MRRSRVAAASVLFAGLLLAGRPAAAEWSPESTGGAGVALGESAGVSLPYGHLGIRLRF